MHREPIKSQAEFLRNKNVISGSGKLLFFFTKPTKHLSNIAYFRFNECETPAEVSNFSKLKKGNRLTICILACSQNNKIKIPRIRMADRPDRHQVNILRNFRIVSGKIVFSTFEIKLD